MEEARKSTGGNGGDGGGGVPGGLYRAPIKETLSERLRGPKKGMFIL